LRKTILDLALNLNDFICEKCGQYMTARKGIHNTYFLGCYNYPECRNTKEIKEIKLSL
jgi:ssDNA-binding Zn-finger/Zn-ribbon topoisomerase 1